MTTTESPTTESPTIVEPTTNGATTVIDTYLAAWNEPDDSARATLTEASLGADLWYRDALLEADGRDAFTAVLGSVQTQFPGLVMRRASGLDAHHDVVRFNWALGAPDEEPVFTGVDIAKFDADGKLHRIIGFTGEAIS